MSQNGYDALKDLWGSFAVSLACVVAACGMAILTSILPTEPAVVEATEPTDPKLAAFWGFVLLGWMFWMLRRYVWRPYWQFQKVALPPRDARLVLGMLWLTAVPQSLILGLWLVPVAWIDQSMWLVVLFLPLIWYWEWLEKRAGLYVERAIGMAGLAFEPDATSGGAKPHMPIPAK